MRQAGTSSVLSDKEASVVTVEIIVLAGSHRVGGRLLDASPEDLEASSWR